jgi:serine/threonine-protein phosphatase 2B regulatory subunit
MGASHSLKAEEIARLQDQTGLDEQALRRAIKSFLSIDRDHSGTLSVDELLEVPELRQNPLVGRLARVIDVDGNGTVDFVEFAKVLGTFASRSGTSLAKAQVMFKIYDVNNDGFISNGDLFKSLKLMVGSNLDDLQLQQLVDRTIFQADTDKDGKLSFDEFLDMIKKVDFEGKLLLDL